MRLKVAGALFLCAAATASANPRETLSFTNVNSDGDYMEATNTVLTQSVTGGYSVGRVRLSGTANTVSPFTWESELVFEVIAPNGENFYIQPSFNDNPYTSVTFNDVEIILDTAITNSTGTWTVRFFEAYDDQGIDSNWATFNLTLDDGPAAVDRFIESTDAGSSLATAAVPSGTGELNVIRGDLAGDQDLFKIQICDPANFVATTMYGTDLDTRLYLFDANGMGVVGNDDTDDGVDVWLQSYIEAPAGLPAGEYYLAVTVYNYMPTDASNQAMWLEQPFETIRTPDGPGALSALDHWVGNRTSAGPYSIYMDGACYVGPTAPACGTSDFNGDGDFGTDADIEAFFACLAGDCCATCYANGSDFNADGDFGTDADIESFFRVLAGGNC